MNYKLISEKGKHHVFEKASQQIIKTFRTRQEAREYLKFLNLGGSWDGWTPSFILNKPQH